LGQRLEVDQELLEGAAAVGVRNAAKEGVVEHMRSAGVDMGVTLQPPPHSHSDWSNHILG